LLAHQIGAELALVEKGPGGTTFLVTLPLRERASGEAGLESIQK
jgi:hypothetical protein